MKIVLLTCGTLTTLLFSSACGDDAPTKYRGTITCTITCDADQAQVMTPVCATNEDIDIKLQAGVDECEAQVQGHCTSHSCECSIPVTLPTCE